MCWEVKLFCSVTLQQMNEKLMKTGNNFFNNNYTLGFAKWFSLLELKEIKYTAILARSSLSSLCVNDIVQSKFIVESKDVFMCQKAEKLRSAVAVVIGMVKKIQTEMLTSEYKCLLFFSISPFQSQCQTLKFLGGGGK